MDHAATLTRRRSPIRPRPLTRPGAHKNGENEMAQTNWSNYLGSQATAKQAMAQYRKEHRHGESLAQWIKRTCAEMFPSDKDVANWDAIARNLERDAKK